MNVLPPECMLWLSKKFFGPYLVIRRVKEVTYDLQLVEDSSILTVFHVSQLWHVLTPAVRASSELPTAFDVANVLMKILEKWYSLMMHEIGLVRWHDDRVTPDTWEDLDNLWRHFPSSLTWGQVLTQEGGGVSDLHNYSMPKKEEGECHTFLVPEGAQTKPQATRKNPSSRAR